MAAAPRMQSLFRVQDAIATSRTVSARSNLHCAVRRAVSPAAFMSAKNSCNALPSSTQKRLFHASSRRLILPPLPQRIEGTANEPVAIHEPNPVHGSFHWTFERLVAAGLVPLTIAPFAAGSLNPVMDAILCGTILLHSHIGFQSIIIDYIPTKRLPRVRKLFWWGLRAATVLVGVGLYQFETNDIGVTETIKKMWEA